MKSALVVVDVQTCFTAPSQAYDEAAAAGDVGAFFSRVNEIVIPKLQDLLAAYRAAKLPIYFTEMGSLRADGSDLPSALREANRLSIEASGNAVIPPLDQESSRTDARIAPREDEIVFRKTTTGTLASTPLGQNLRALGCEHVAVAGIVTDCCVAQTSRELSDQDFRVTVVEDGCASYVPAHHRAILEIFQNFYGAVDSAEAVIASLPKA
ncbi:MAG: isochorismatase family cysteine hydrolase [Pseudomonadota bacterium]